MSSTELPPIPPIIAQLTGPLLLGHFFNWGLFGALTVQCYIYYLAFPNDRPIPKTLVAFTYTIEVLQTVLSTRDAFRNFGTGWGNMIELDAVGWLWFSVPVLGSIISCTGQLFYAWRIWILSESYWISIVVILLSLTQCGTGIYSGALAHMIGEFSKVQERSFKTTAVWLGGTALCDIIIAASMIYYLHKSNTGFRTTTTLLSKFIRVTIETGLVCATFAILDMSLFIAFQQNNYHLAPSIPLSKLYSNSLLVVFNARVRIVGGRNPDTHPSAATLSVGSTNSRYQYPRSTYRKSGGNPIAVSISQTQASETPVERYGPGEIQLSNVSKYPRESSDLAPYDKTPEYV
ncbi:hypothetical protein K474DRAFT_1707275 [Panus rudis PR-1116 ss-1]|nr:hypothetical protein K474DRAFT_1707275 [Panus rudis PR-1116 ss-1]